LNAKHYNIPQNRERVFIVGIRDDQDNNFTWPKEEFLERRLRDVLESDVDEKYYFSEKMIKSLVNHSDIHKEKGNGFKFEPKDLNDIGNSVTTKSGQRTTDNFIRCNQGVAIGAIRGRNPDNPTSRVSGQSTQQMLEINENGTSNALTTVQKDNVVVYTGIAVHPFSKKLEFDGFKDGNCPTLLATDYKAPKCVQYSDYRIRKLTPRECFRLMDFPETFSWPVSD